jgi:uncharacterized protein YcfJ
VVELEVDPEREATVDADDVAEGERERGGRSVADVDGAREDEDVDEEAVTNSVGGIAVGGVNGYFLGRPRGRLTLMVAAGDAAEATAGTDVRSVTIGVRCGAGAGVAAD